MGKAYFFQPLRELRVLEIINTAHSPAINNDQAIECANKKCASLTGWIKDREGRQNLHQEEMTKWCIQICQHGLYRTERTLFQMYCLLIYLFQDQLLNGLSTKIVCNLDRSVRSILRGYLVKVHLENISQYTRSNFFLFPRGNIHYLPVIIREKGEKHLKGTIRYLDIWISQFNIARTKHFFAQIRNVA